MHIYETILESTQYRIKHVKVHVYFNLSIVLENLTEDKLVTFSHFPQKMIDIWANYLLGDKLYF